MPTALPRVVVSLLCLTLTQWPAVAHPGAAELDPHVHVSNARGANDRGTNDRGANDRGVNELGGDFSSNSDEQRVSALTNDASASPHARALAGEIDEGPGWVAPSRPVSPTRAEGAPSKTGMVYGYLQAGKTAAAVARWDLMTQVVWFGVTMSTSGTVSNSAGIGDAKYQEIRRVSRDNGVELLIGAILFNSAADPNKVATFINNKATAIPVLVDLMLEHDADGISLDLEVVPESHKAAYASLLSDLSLAAKAARPGAHISSAVPPPTGWKGYDYHAITNASDSVFVMAYDYYWVSGPNAGPVTPKNDGTMWGTLNYTQSLNKFVSTLTPSQLQKLVIGLPWYGYDWPTVSSALQAKVDKTRTAKARTFSVGRTYIESASTGRYDALSEQPYAVYDEGGTRQLWLDNGASFGAKAQMIVDRAMGGVGLFAVNYEGGAPEFWNEIEQRYTDHAPMAVLDVAGAGRAGATLIASARQSSDPDGDALSFEWTCTGCLVSAPSGGEAAGPEVKLVLGATGAAQLRLLVRARALSAAAEASIVIDSSGQSSGGSSGGSGTGASGGTNGGAVGETSGSATGPQSNEISGTRAPSLAGKAGCNSAGDSSTALTLCAAGLWLARRRVDRAH